MTKRFNYFLFGITLLGVLALSFKSADFFKEKKSHLMHRGLTDDVNSLFAGSGKCAGCHGYDPLGVTSVDTNGLDVNLVSDWRSSMMANSAKDPFWLAKVSHEVQVNPGHQTELEHTCTKCHAPQGHFNAIHEGASHYSLSDLKTDTIGLDGVSCSSCHQQDPSKQGMSFSGNLKYDTTKTVYGPYSNPFSSPMANLVGFNPVHDVRVLSSKACADCHSLVVQTADLSGNYTGNNFVEQATYHEWLNSSYSDNNNLERKTCQECHLPKAKGDVILATDYAFVGGRSPFGKHHLVGGNSFMLNLLKENMDSLGIQATSIQFDSTIDRTNKYLRQQTLNLTLTETNIQNDTAYYNLNLENLAGHKFPSGYPSRRAFIQFIVQKDNGDTLFKSGLWNSNYELINYDSNYEPHYDIIDEENKVQVYEMVFADVNGNKTTILERGDSYLKDNRLVPKGFLTSHSSYDTTKLTGLVLSDPNFNYNGLGEGSGTDEIEYRVKLSGYTGDLNVIAKVFYQPVPPEWMQEMFSVSTYEIDRFKDMYLKNKVKPNMVAQALQGSLFTSVENNKDVLEINVFPNPTQDKIFIQGLKGNSFEVFVYSLSGKLISKQYDQTEITLPIKSGVYIVRINYGNNFILKKIVRK